MDSSPLTTKLGLDNSVSANLAIMALAITIGLAIGGIRFRSLKLGISGVLFSSLVFGQLGFAIDAKVLQFLRNFALIIFMYSIGLQVGPGFGASLRRGGIRLNALSLCVIVLGAVIAAAVAPWVPRATAPGLYAGAFTTTAGLAAAQEAMRGTAATAGEALASAQSGLAYSITYPLGIVGPMLLIVILRSLFRVRLDSERAALAAAEESLLPHIELADIEVTNPAHAGVRLRDYPPLQNDDVIFSRVLRADVMTVPTGDTLVQVGDIYRAIGPRDQLAQLVTSMGRRTDIDFSKVHGDVGRVELLVTQTPVLHRPLRELDLIHRAGVTIARVNRAGISLVPTGSLRLAFADQVTAVGPKAGLRLVEAELGNSPERLNHPQLVPIFLGMVLGVIVGSIPLVLPGLNGNLHIGLAGGSLLAAIALSRLGSVGSVVWYMPAAANQLFRDFGLAVFLACVGFEAGDHFIQRAANYSGLILLAWGAVITLLPVFLVACFARLALRMNFVTLCGWIAGAMGNSTTLLFAEELTSSNAPAITYAAVVPTAELMPIICAQILAVLTVHH